MQHWATSCRVSFAAIAETRTRTAWMIAKFVANRWQIIDFRYSTGGEAILKAFQVSRPDHHTLRELVRPRWRYLNERTRMLSGTSKKMLQRRVLPFHVILGRPLRSQTGVHRVNHGGASKDQTCLKGRVMITPLVFSSSTHRHVWLNLSTPE